VYIVGENHQTKSSEKLLFLTLETIISSIPGAGWDYSLSRHPYHEIERAMKPYYCVYNRRLMACCFDTKSTEESYWLLRQKAALLNTGEFPLQFAGPDAERLLDKLFTKDITRLKVGRCGYGLACYENGGLIVDGILLRLTEDRFWYAQADGDFYSWARAHAVGMDVEITDPKVYVSQVQGPIKDIRSRQWRQHARAVRLFCYRAC
jgi:aminomethyltransferase